MKLIKRLFILLLTLSAFTGINQLKAQQQYEQEDVNFDTFYDDLSPYGTWVEHPTYGEVWIYNEPGFRPYYTNGHWDYTEYGWTWESDYEWGWAAFHYGRWEFDPSYGWMWIPGYEWAPAWVSWSENDDYYGWAPLGYGLDVSISIGRIPYDRWVFMPRQYITSSRIYDYCVPFNRNNYIIRNTHVINNYYGTAGRGRFMMGPDRGDVERFTHARIVTRQFNRQERFGPAFRNRNNGFSPNNGNNWNGGNNSRGESRRQIFGDNNNRSQIPQPVNRGFAPQNPSNGWNGNRGDDRQGRTRVERNDQVINNPQPHNNDWQERVNNNYPGGRTFPNQQSVPAPNPQRNNNWVNRSGGNYGNEQRSNAPARSFPQRQDNRNNGAQQRGWERSDNRQDNGGFRGNDRGGNGGGRGWGGRRG
jgi:hypothetical protein